MEDRTDQERSKANMNSLMNSLSSVRIRGGAFPLITIDLDASVGPLSFLNLEDRARTEAVSHQFREETRSPLFWEEFVEHEPYHRVETRKRFTYEHSRMSDTYFIRAFVRKTPRLSLLKRLLDTDVGGGELTDASFITIGACCPALTSLRVDNIGEAGLRALGTGCPAMEKLVIMGNHEPLTDAALVYAVERFPKLSVFKIHPNECDDKNFILTDATMLALATHCPLLTNIELFHARLTDNSIPALVRGCQLLETLDLHSCCLRSGWYPQEEDEAITEVSMIAIAEHCPALRNLDLSFNQRLSNEGIIAVARGCPLLEEMSCDQCDWLNYKAIRTISEIIPRFNGY